MSDMGCPIPVMNDKAKKEMVCVWKWDEEELQYWLGCIDYRFTESDKGDFKFCPYCGKKIEVML